MVELVKKVHSMRSELYQIKSDNSDDVKKAAELLGNGIKHDGVRQRLPLDIEDNKSTIPKIVVKFLPSYTDRKFL